MKKELYSKIISAAIGLTAFLLAFAATVAIPQLLAGSNESVEEALPAFTEITVPEEAPASAAREIYIIKSNGSSLVVCDEYGKIIDTYVLSSNLPAEEKAALQQGITVFGKEALLNLLEDYSE
ncbi:MAG: hypothetical protein LBT88_00140 [Oscillospiraceae bacterium]|jgi:hypothetical protein|nr:hypothetical protein [Oscillospiraceae bacterium]